MKKMPFLLLTILFFAFPMILYADVNADKQACMIKALEDQKMAVDPARVHHWVDDYYTESGHLIKGGCVTT